MILIVQHTNEYSHNRSVLVDLGNYLDAVEWADAIIHNKAVFKPALCGIKFENEWYYLVSAGHVAVDADVIISKMRCLSVNTRKIPNDNMIVQADTQDRTLYIELGANESDCVRG